MAPVLLFLLLGMAGYVRPSSIVLTDNGYDDILIAVTEEVPPEEGPDIIAALQDLFNFSTRALYVAAKGRAHFRGATLLVPAAWNSNITRSGLLRPSDADVVVSGSAWAPPWVLHHRGCGQPALRITVPGRFLRDSTLSKQEKGMSFVRAWTEFRYGVFPEGGFFGDDRYPPYRGVPGDPHSLRVTACVDPNPRFDNKSESGEECQPTIDAHSGEPENPLCMPRPLLDEMETPPLSSITYQQMSPHAAMLCEGALNLGPRHNPLSASKHNLVCREESAWHVLLRSPDFTAGRNAATKYKPTPFRLRLLQENSAPNIVVAVDVSVRMRHQSRYSLTLGAFARLASSELPDGSRLGVVVFSSTATGSAPVELGEPGSRSRFLGSEPLPQEPTDEEEACIDCALEKAVEMLKSGENPIEGGTILLFTSKVLLNTSVDDLVSLLSGVRLHTILFSSGDLDETFGDLQSLCEATRGDMVVLGETQDEAYQLLQEATASWMPDDVLIAEEWLTPSKPNLNFTLDHELSNELRVTIARPGLSLPLQADRTTLKNAGGVLGDFQRLDFVPAWRIVVPRPQAGKFEFETEWKDTSPPDPVLVSVRVRSKERKSISARFWLEQLDITEAMMVFAEVRHGDRPVSGALVTATVLHPHETRKSHFLLLDDGNTTPDMTSSDGVYSRTFTQMTSPGSYTVTVAVVGDNNTFELHGPAGDCCGSFFPARSRRPTGSFTRLLGPKSFVEHFNASRPDPHPPSRVTDLAVQRTYGRTFLLTWSAAGGDYENGHASKYELRLFADLTQLRHGFESGRRWTVEVEAVAPVPYGQRLVHTFQAPPEAAGGTRFFAVRALDSNGNAGEPSNAVEVWIEAEGEVEAECNQPLQPPQPLGSSATAISTAFMWMLVCLLIYA